MGFPAIFSCAAPLWRRQTLLHIRGIAAGQSGLGHCGKGRTAVGNGFDAFGAAEK
jgi:hypothetical protein